MNEEMFEGRGGLNLFSRSWLPAQRPHGIVVIVHGFKSHSGLYQWVAEKLVECELAVYALDLRGHGKSEGERFFVNKFADYVDDLSRFISIVKLRNSGVPIYLLGHSAGGVVACTYALDHQQELAGLIAESFAAEVPAPAFALAMMKGLSLIAPRAQVLKLHDKDFSRDPEFVAAMKSDPLIVRTKGASKTAAEMVRADARLAKEFASITLPVLILHGTADKTTKPSGSQHFYNASLSFDKTLKLYSGHFHDLLNDVDKEVVMADIQEWITSRLSVQPAAGR
jgi:acylglycerol lipase